MKTPVAGSSEIELPCDAHIASAKEDGTSVGAADEQEGRHRLRRLARDPLRLCSGHAEVVTGTPKS